MPIRPPTPDDVKAMLALADAKRSEYEGHSPTFWRKAPDGVEKQRDYFHSLLNQASTIALVSEESGQIQGFIIATLGDAPPVYDPGTRVVVIDDFTVADAALWPTVGTALLNEARAAARTQGAELSIVVCGHLDRPKREMLAACGFSLASEWYVNPA